MPTLTTPGERVELSFHRSIERLDLGCLVAGGLGIDVNDVPVFGLEMHVCVLQFAEALSKKSCTDKENKRECGLEDDEGALQERCARSRGARSGAQSFSGLRLGGDPCRGNSKENAGHQRKSERKRDDEQRGSGIDRDILRTGKGQRQEHLRPAVSDDEARKSPKDRQRHAFRQELSDNAAALGAERCANGYLRAPVHPADEQKIGNVGACDEKYEGRNPCQQMKMRLVLLLHLPECRHLPA